MSMGDYNDNLLPYGGYMVWVVGGGVDGAWFYDTMIMICILSHTKWYAPTETSKSTNSYIMEVSIVVCVIQPEVGSVGGVNNRCPCLASYNGVEIIFST